jgi:hypothetical protein
MIKATVNIVKLALLLLLMLFVVALVSPVKAVYVLNITLSYLYIVLASVGNFVVHCALYVLKLRS